MDTIYQWIYLLTYSCCVHKK